MTEDENRQCDEFMAKHACRDYRYFMQDLWEKEHLRKKPKGWQEVTQHDSQLYGKCPDVYPGARQTEILNDIYNYWENQAHPWIEAKMPRLRRRRRRSSLATYRQDKTGGRA